MSPATSASGRSPTRCTSPTWPCVPTPGARGSPAALLSSVLDNARARGFKIVVLEVRPSNHHALTLYESFGFRVVGRRHGYYYDTGEDALVMEIALRGQSTSRGNQAAR